MRPTRANAPAVNRTAATVRPSRSLAMVDERQRRHPHQGAEQKPQPEAAEGQDLDQGTESEPLNCREQHQPDDQQIDPVHGSEGSQRCIRESVSPPLLSSRGAQRPLSTTSARTGARWPPSGRAAGDTGGLRGRRCQFRLCIRHRRESHPRPRPAGADAGGGRSARPGGNGPARCRLLRRRRTLLGRRYAGVGSRVGSGDCHHRHVDLRRGGDAGHRCHDRRRDDLGRGSRWR